MSDTLFEKYKTVLTGKTIGEVWRGHDSIFLECAEPGAVMRRDGLTDQLLGHYTVMIEGGWRIADGDTVLCETGSDDATWKTAAQRLTGGVIETASLSADLAELGVEVSGGLRLCSLKGDEPGWRIFDRRSVPGEEMWIKVRDGAIFEDR